MAGPLKVLLIADRLEPCGISTYTESLARGLVQFGHEVSMLTPGGSLTGRLNGAGFEVFVERSMNRWWGRSRAVHRTARSMSGGKPDVVHAMNVACQRSAAAAAGHLGAPYVMTVQRFNRRPDPVRIHRACGGVIAISDAIRENLVNDVRVSKDLISTVPDGLDLSRYKVPPERAEGAIPIVGSVGRLVPDRGMEYLLQAAAIVKEAGHDPEYVIAGDGPEKVRLLRLASKLGLRERLTISPGAADYASVLPAIDIFVAPSTNEGLGIHILEAMACGRPIVASSVGGIFTLVKDGKGGFLVPPRDPEAIAKVVISLIKDPHLRVAMGSYSRAQAESSFGLAKMVEGTEAVYRRAIQGS